jgi:hypothetical protein
VVTLTRETLHQKLLKDSISGKPTEADTLLWMVLLHTHQIHLRPEVVAGVNGAILDFPAITQRHAAEVAAQLWKELYPADREKADYTYWYWRYNTETPYEVVEDIPDALRPRLLQLRDLLGRDSRIAAVTPEA